MRSQSFTPHTVQSAAQATGLSVTTIRRWIAQRKIAHIRIGRSLRVPSDEVERLLTEGRIERQ